VTFHVDGGEAFVPRLFAEWDPAHPAITSVSVSRPTLDDVFMQHTGTTIRDAETAGAADRNRATLRTLAGARR
jgi:ABC-2 type transport system ATP-binding protein